MDYKSIIKSPKTRQAILKFLRFVPDELMLRLQYYIKMGRTLNLKKPKRFTEKLQWYKLYHRNPLMKQCVHKYKVRDYVKSKGLEHILVPLIGKYDTLEQVDFEALPEQFIIKSANGGGGLNVVLCTDKQKLNFEEIKKRIVLRVIPPHSGAREWAYHEVESGIVIEELLINKANPAAGINDYKFFCYQGKPKYIVLDTDRYIGHKRNFYDTEWNNLHITSDCPAVDREIEKPSNLEEMVKVAAKLSEDFPYVRVDLYSVEDKVYFGELTFYPWSGYVQYTPDEADFLFGEDFPLIPYK